MKNTFSIIPQPQQLKAAPGRFRLDAHTVIAVHQGAEAQGERLAFYLRPATGFPLPVLAAGKAKGHVITLRLDAMEKELGQEGYTLSVTPGQVTLGALTERGLFYGIQTIRQLLPPAIFRDVPVPGPDWSMPAVEIRDVPRFGWRGLMLDCCRHYMPKHFIKRLVDLAALHKLNSVHLHLTEDQGWRLEIKKYPKLTQVGAWRPGSLVGHQSDPCRTFDKIPHGGFYTQDDMREIVRYAQDRMVTIVPEIELPGHAQAAVTAYPELGVTGRAVGVRQEWGISQDIYNPNPGTITFLKNVLKEVLDIFPSPYIHIGGDEALKNQWEASPAVQKRIKELGLKDEHELQSWFISQFDTFLQAQGRRLIGWDEILEGGLAAGATVMSWRGVDGGIKAAQAGHDVVMAPCSHTYFDHYQTGDTTHEPRQIGGNLPIEKVYGYEPIPAELTAEQAKHVLGVQGQMWTEYISSPHAAEYAIFPRACALSEVGWTLPARKNYGAFSQRLKTHLERLRVLDVNFRPFSGQLFQPMADCRPL